MSVHHSQCCRKHFQNRDSRDAASSQKCQSMFALKNTNWALELKLMNMLFLNPQTLFLKAFSDLKRDAFLCLLGNDMKRRSVCGFQCVWKVRTGLVVRQLLGSCSLFLLS